MEHNQQWLTTKQASEAMGCSPRHLRNLINNGKIWAKRDGKNWRVHSSLLPKPPDADDPTESLGKPNGIPAAPVIDHQRILAAFEEQIYFLKEQIAEKDRQIQDLTTQNDKLLTLMAMEKSEKKAIAENAESLEARITQYKLPWWRRMFNGQA